MGNLLDTSNIKHRLTNAALVILIAMLFRWLFSQTAAYQDMRNWVFDRQQQTLTTKFNYDDVVVFDIDESSKDELRRLYSWPFNRKVYAQIIRYLKNAGAKAVVFDMTLDDKVEGLSKLVRELDGYDKGVFAVAGRNVKVPRSDLLYKQNLNKQSWKATDGTPAANWVDVELPEKILGTKYNTPPRARVGLINLYAVANTIRKVPLLHKVYDTYLPSLSLAALNVSEQGFSATSYNESKGELSFGLHKWPVDADGEATILYSSNFRDIPTQSFWKLELESRNADRKNVFSAALKDKVIFIGSSDEDHNDLHLTPLGKAPGVNILAHIYTSLKTDQFLKPVSNSINLLLLVLAIVLPVVGALTKSRQLLWIGVLGFVSVVAIVGISVGAFTVAQQQVDVVLPLACLIFVLTLLVIWRLKEVSDESRRMYYEKAAAEQANELKSEFLAHMTHELRTPLTAVIGFNRLLNDSQGQMPAASSGQYHRIIDSNCQHLLSLINNILDHARINAGQVSVKRSPTQVRGLISNVLNSVHSLAGDKKLELKAMYESDLPKGLMLDELHLRRVLINLVGNAIKFTDKGHVHVHVGWSAGWMELRVEDTGPGISDQVMEQIFESFQQGDVTGAKQYGGTGLGLTICRHLVGAMEGTVEVESQVDEGSIFILRIPAASCEVPERQNAPIDNKVEPVPEKIKAKVLVADDNADLRALMNVYLKSAGCNVIFAENGEVAVNMAMEENPDLVLMDLEMPVMDGYQAIMQLREREFAAPIIACSAHTAADMKRALGGLSGIPTLQKPLRKEQLLKAVNRILSAKQTGGEQE